MARFRILVAFASLSLLFACGDKDDPGGGGGGGGGEKSPAKILTFEATPATLPTEGGTVRLEWTSEGAVDGQLLANGEVIEDSVWPLSKGDFEWEIFEPTTFELRLEGDGGDASEEVRVELAEDVPVIVSFVASPAEILRGEATLLRWETENTDSIELLDEEGAPVDIAGASTADGAVGVRPKVSTRYKLIATRGEAQVEATAEVTVLPVELKIVSFDQTQPGARLPGEAVELDWVVEGADAIEVSNLEGEEIQVDEDQLGRGSATLTMGEEGRFRLVATQDGESVEEELRLVILTPPAIGALVAVPPAVTEPSGTTELKWSGVERAATLTLERDPGEPMDLTGAGLEEGMVTVDVDADTRFVLVAENAAGEARSEVSVDLVAPPELVSFRATPARVGAGEAFTLAWTSEGATQISIENEHGPLPELSDWMVSDEVVLQIMEDTEYVLRLTNAAGDSLEERLTVTVGPPEILSAAFAPPFVGVGQPTSLAWEVLGGTELRVLDASEGVVCSTTDAAEIAAGSCPITATAEGSFDYRLQIENGVDQRSEAVISLMAGEGPYIVSFAAEPAEIEEGGSVEFSWEVLDDPLGDPMTLTLSDGAQDFDISDTDPNEGTKSFALADVGSHVFTLTASSTNGSRQAVVDVEVFGLPVVSLSSSAAVYEGTDPITLSWTSEYTGGGLVLYEVDDGGQLVELYEVPEGERASGTFDVEPTDDTTYRIVADNGVGSTASDELSLTIGPPVILSFDASPVEVVRGDDVALSWTTRLADSVELDLPMQAEEVSGDPFVDISSTGSQLVLTDLCAKQFDPIFGWLPFDADDEGCATLNLPSGFDFPFSGDIFNSLRVYANGVIGFDFTFEEFTYWNEPFPSIWPVHIAPMWNDQELVQIWYEFGSDSEGQYVVVQWESKLFDFSADLAYQAVLRDDGSFIFRYGGMTGDTDLDQEMADGSSATIGYQNLDGTETAMLHFGGLGLDIENPMPGGLSNRTWAFRGSYAPNDSLVFVPQASQTVTLTAFGQNGEVSDTVDIVVHEAPEVAVVRPSEEPQAGWAFDLGWESAHADSVEILDGSGTVICAAAPEEVEAGACSITEAAPGVYDYTVRAHGALGSTDDEPVTIEVFPTFVLETFEADAEAVDPGGSVTLSWITHGAVSVELTANGTDILPSGASPAADSAVHAPAERTTYVLTIEAVDGRTREAEVEVELRTVELTVGMTPGTIQPGESSSLSWDATALVGGTPTVYLPMTETISVYTDISGDPNAVELLGVGEDGAGAVHTFANGFSFPFGGELHTELKVFTDGFVSFDTGSFTSFTNDPFPVESKDQVHIAPFWDDLHTRADGRVYALESGGSYIIQWSEMSRWAGSDDSNQYDLNFQLVLHADGGFEFLYGAMQPPPNVTDSNCTLDDCSLDAQGASATIGYQNPSATVGYNLHFGGSRADDTNVVFPGGIANRAYSKAGGASGNLVFYPSESTDYEVCAELTDYFVCEEASLTVQSP